jgi:hypothetical protein
LLQTTVTTILTNYLELGLRKKWWLMRFLVQIVGANVGNPKVGRPKGIAYGRAYDRPTKYYINQPPKKLMEQCS